MSETQLIKYQKTVITKLDPLQAVSLALRDKAKNLKVSTDKDLATANVLKKTTNEHIKKVSEMRLDYTRKIDAFKSAIMDKEKEILNPAQEAKTDLASKILEYEEEQERQREAEAQRIDNIVGTLTVNPETLTTLDAVEAAGKQLKERYTEVSPKDKANPQIKLTFTTSANTLVHHKEHLIEEERQRVERKRLAEEAKEQSAERQKIEAEKRRIEEEKRQIEAERRQRELDAKQEQLKKEAAEKQAEEIKRLANRPKSNIAIVTNIEVVDEDAVPCEYCSPDMKKIREALKSGRTDIPGVQVTKSKQVR